MNKMKYCRLLMALVLLFNLSIFQLIPATAAENPLLFLDYTEIDDTHFAINFMVSDIPEVDVIAIPIAFNNKAVVICGYDAETKSFYDITDGVKTADDFYDGKNGVVLYDAFVGENGWEGILVENELYPYISNSEEIIRFTAFSVGGNPIKEKNKIMSVYFNRISNEEPRIRIASSENAINYDRASSRGISFVREGELVDVEIQYSGDVFDEDYVEKRPDEKPSDKTDKTDKTDKSDSESVTKPVPSEKEEEKEPVKEEQNLNTSNEKILFTDVSDDFWAYTPIMSLASNKTINGYDNNTFRPNNFITRAELAKIAILAKGIDVSETVNLFTDVNSDSWYAPYLTVAYNNNIITGYPDKTFRPNNNVSRQDLCVILYRTFFDGENVQISEDLFADDDEIADYAKNAVNYLAQQNILNGRENNMFVPADNATRAEAAKIVYLCLEAVNN